MANLKNIEKDRTEVIKDLKPNEMLVYMESLITNLYEAFIEHNEEKALTSRELIEEATDLYIAKGYTNSHAVETNLRLNKANDLLVETLEAKQKKEIELSKVIVENYYSELILEVLHANSILKSLLASYEKEPSEELASAIKDVAGLENNRLSNRSYLTEERNSSYFSEELEILKTEYATFQDLLNKIANF